MTDPEGVSYGVSNEVWYDDGHSADWVQGTVQGFPSTPGNTAAVRPDVGGPSVGVLLTLVHVNKPPNPPDR